MPTIFFNQLENPSKNLGPNLGPTERPNSKLTSKKRRLATLSIQRIAFAKAIDR